MGLSSGRVDNFLLPAHGALSGHPARNLSKVIFSVYRITVAAITTSALTSVAFAGCREPAPIFRHDCDRSEQIIYGSPAPNTAITKYTKYHGNHYGNQTHDTEGQPPYPPYYPYPDYAPSYALVITGYDGPRKAKLCDPHFVLLPFASTSRLLHDLVVTMY
jgi:hypothetical protein